MGLPIPRAGHLLPEHNCVLNVPVLECGDRPFAEWLVRLPVKLHGAGFHGHEERCHAAYLGALEVAAPYMAGVPGLEEVMGGREAWGEDSDPGTRWATLLASGHQDGQELRAAWAHLQRQAREAATYLGEEVEGVMADQVEGAGKDSSGHLRQALTERWQQVTGSLLQKALEQHPDKTARPVWSWPQRDKHSAAWLLCLPTPDTSFSAAEFAEACAALLCLPSPACASRVGVPVPGRERVCVWGDTVNNSAMRGDGWRVRHDAVKLRLRGLLTWAGIPSTCEVFNLFADCIPQDGLNRLERGRRRQGLVPDFMVPGGPGEGEILCELKLISASKSRYPRNPQPRDGKRAVDRRADGLTAEYTRKARQVDQNYGGVPRPPPALPGAPQLPRVVGRVERRLQAFGEVRGWCFGAWGEASQECHAWVQRIAAARVEVADMQPGRQRLAKSDVAQLASNVGFVRRSLSFTVVQQQAKLLLGRLCLLGDGAAEAQRRRQRAEAAEAVAARERRAQAVCLRQGRDIRRHGFGLLG